MSEEPLVSVVMIFRDEIRFMKEAVQSVLAQTYGNWELLLVDDGSRDGSSALAREFAARHPQRIRYLQHARPRRRGMSASRNLGLAEASGRYIGFLDADDVYRSQKLERQVAILEARPSAAMVYGATTHWYSWTGNSEDRDRDEVRNLGVAPDTLVQPPALIPPFLRNEAQTPGTCGVLIRRETVAEVGGFEEEFRGMFEDQVFLFKVCLRYPVYVESGRTDLYRQHPESHSRRMRRLGVYATRDDPNPTREKFLRWLEGYLEEFEPGDFEVRAALEAELHPYRNRATYWGRQTRRFLRRLGERILR